MGERSKGEQPVSEHEQVAQNAINGNLARQLVWQELFRERGWLWQLVVATCLINLFAVSTSLFAMQVYDRVVPTLAYTTLTTLAAGMARLDTKNSSCTYPRQSRKCGRRTSVAALV